jgi:NAD(P)H dehydrogenase (quinone)
MATGVWRKMKITVLLAHPDKKSFNYAVAEAAAAAVNANGHQAVFHDLYREKFPPVIPAGEIPRDVSLPPIISRHCAEIADADGIIIAHPNWWGQPPAILKGWIDRVLRPGVAYTFTEGDSGVGALIGLLKASAVLVFNTSNTPVERETTVYGNPLETLWKNNMFISCGVKSFYRRNFGMIITSTLEQRQEWLEEVRDTTNKFFPRGLVQK